MCYNRFIENIGGVELTNLTKASKNVLKPFKIDIFVKKIVNIDYFEFFKKYHTFRDSHPFRELIFVDSGTITVDAEMYSGTLTNRQLLIHKSNEIHSLSCSEENAPNVIIIGFDCDCKELDIFSKRVHTLSSNLIKLLTEVIKESRLLTEPSHDALNTNGIKMKKNFPFGADQMLILKLESFLIELIRSTEMLSGNNYISATDHKLQEIVTYINNNYNRKITINDLCFIFGTNRTTLCKKFRDSFGYTLVNYINKLRIKEAKKLLHDGNMSISQIAAITGFDSVQYFSKTFKKIENNSPIKYINSVKSKLDNNQ